MKSINSKKIREIANAVLFENQISERFRPDDFTNSRTAMYDRPGPQINGSQEEESEEELEIPLVADDFVSNTAFIKRDHRVRDDKDYCPQNPTELSSSLTSLIDDYKNDNDINNNHIESIWISVNKILQKI